MAISSQSASIDFNNFLDKNIIEDAVEKEKEQARRSGSEADPEKHFKAERLAPLLRALAMAGAGGALGYRMSGGDLPKPMGAYVGALAGGGTSALMGLAALVAANITKRRKMKEQIESDEKGVLAKYLVPGLADYDGAKRYEAAKYDTYEKKGSDSRTAIEKIAGGAFHDYLAYGPIGAAAAKREQILDEEAEAIADPRHKGSSPTHHAISEALGTYTSARFSGLAGRIIGMIAAKLSGGNVGQSGSTGQTIGYGVAGLSNLVGAIAAGIKRRRTKDEQIEHDKGSTIKDMLVPGFAMYNGLKRTGVAFDKNDEKIRELVEKKRKQAKNGGEKKAEDVQSETPNYGAFGIDWDNIGRWLKDIKYKYYDSQDDGTKMLMSAGGGALGGALLSKIVGGNALGGAVLGGAAGALPHVDWKRLNEIIGESQKPKPAGQAETQAQNK